MPNENIINKEGLTMEQANDPKYWKDGKYVGYDTTFVPKEGVHFNPLFSGPAIDVPGLPDPTAPASNLVDGTQDAEDDDTIAAQDVEAGITAAEDNQETTDATLARLTNEQAQSKILNKSELDAIDAAGEEARLAYETLVEEQQENRRKTLPSEIVRAGEKGGFLSTQQAGIAAILPTGKVAGEAFTGTTARSAEFPDGQRGGGILDRKRQTLDRAVVLAKSKQQEAILAAKRAQRAAIMTGKRSDYDMSLNLAKLAQQFANDAQSAEMEKKRLDLTTIKTQFDIAKEIPFGQTVEINGQTFTGLDIAEVDPFFKGSDIISLMKSLPVGTEQTITDPNTGREYTLTGLETDDPNVKSVQSYNDQGELTVTSYRLNADGTMDLLSQASAGIVGKTKTQAANISLQIRQETAGVLADISDALDADKGGDNKVSPAKYGEMQKKYIRSTIGDANEFKRTFPPTEYLDPNNPDSLQYFQTSANVVKGLEDEDDSLPAWAQDTTTDDGEN